VSAIAARLAGYRATCAVDCLSLEPEWHLDYPGAGYRLAVLAAAYVPDCALRRKRRGIAEQGRQDPAGSGTGTEPEFGGQAASGISAEADGIAGRIDDAHNLCRGGRSGELARRRG